MSDYIECLALSYFKENGKKYNLEELRSLLGLTQAKFDEIISKLKENKLVEYVNFEIAISDRGLMHLINHNLIRSSLEDAEFQFKNIDVKNAISIETIYVPKEFAKKT